MDGADAIGVEPLGDRALLLRPPATGDDEAALRWVRAAAERLDAAGIAGLVETVAGWSSVAIHYDPLRVPPGPGSAQARIAAAARGALATLAPAELHAAPALEIPVCYGGAFGPDLADVAAHHGTTAERVVELHSAGEYTVRMIGFLPGFPYLQGLLPELATPRRSVPRVAVPAGSVGIGGDQTGVYPLTSPGGWNLIGRTPVALFDPDRAQPALLRAGDRVRFRPIDADRFRALGDSL